MKCNLAHEQISQCLDNQPHSKLPEAVDKHLGNCNDCAQYFEHQKQLQQQLAALKAPLLSDDFELRLASKINQLEQSSTQVVTLKQPEKPYRFTTWAMAASIAMTVIGLTWLMLPESHQSQPIAALEDEGSIIEIETLIAVTAPQLLDTSESIEPMNDAQIELSSFDQFTQIDDGYQDFNCGSTSGARGCTLAIDQVLDDLTISI